jgi:hypothetical protein
MLHRMCLLPAEQGMGGLTMSMNSTAMLCDYQGVEGRHAMCV